MAAAEGEAAAGSAEAERSTSAGQEWSDVAHAARPRATRACATSCVRRFVNVSVAETRGAPMERCARIYAWGYGYLRDQAGAASRSYISTDTSLTHSLTLLPMERGRMEAGSH